MTSTAPRRPPRAVRWTLAAVAALLLAPPVGAAIAFVLTYAIPVAVLALPSLLVSARKSTGRHERRRPAKTAPRWAPVGQHALAH